MNCFPLLTIQENFCLDADKHRAKEVALGYSCLLEFAGAVFFLAISANINSPSSSVDNDDALPSL
jgi:hypothetical protein